MASLGTLSAEVTHEINTPIGISITSTSYLSDTISHLKQDLTDNKVSKKAIESFVDKASKSTQLLASNLNRASELITSFKHVAVDQISDKVRFVNMTSYIDEIIQSLHPRLKQTSHCVKVHCDKDIEIYSHPGAIAQIIINLIINSIIHGFDGINRGEIDINIKREQDDLHIVYQDNGRGVSKEALAKLFDPFYTTKPESGGTGLGTHIIHNLVVDTLNGTIKADSIEGEGLKYHIIIPDMRS